MPRSLADDAREIFAAAVDAVDSARLVREAVVADSDTLTIRTESPLTLPSAEVDSLLVVGAGKAGQGMTAGLWAALPAEWRSRTRGLVNVPADCVPDEWNCPIVLHAARPAGDNNPHPAGVGGTRRMQAMLAAAGPRDVVVVLLSGGGSALLTDLRCTLEEARFVVSVLSSRGATIAEMNAVRRQLSNVKGGRLLVDCSDSPVAVLAISDVIADDPWPVIASGPTTAIDADAAAAEARAVVAKFALNDSLTPELVAKIVQTRPPVPVPTRLHRAIVGANRTAVDAAAAAAIARGYDCIHVEADRTGEANAIGHELGETLRRLRSERPSECIAVISGGEPVVRFETTPGKGGRNQQLVLAALAASDDWDRVALLSGGTDGEDGPTDAAGGVVDAAIARNAATLDVAAAHRASAAYDLLAAAGGLIRTGPTHTNVMDVRVGLVAPA